MHAECTNFRGWSQFQILCCTVPINIPLLRSFVDLALGKHGQARDGIHTHVAKVTYHLLLWEICEHYTCIVSRSIIPLIHVVSMHINLFQSLVNWTEYAKACVKTHSNIHLLVRHCDLATYFYTFYPTSPIIFFKSRSLSGY